MIADHNFIIGWKSGSKVYWFSAKQTLTFLCKIVLKVCDKLRFDPRLKGYSDLQDRMYVLGNKVNLANAVLDYPTGLKDSYSSYGM